MVLENVNNETDCNGVVFKIGDVVKEIYYTSTGKKYILINNVVVGFNRYGGIYLIFQGHQYNPLRKNLVINPHLLEITQENT